MLLLFWWLLLRGRCAVDVVRHVNWSLLGQEEDRIELDLAFGSEVRVSQWIQIVLEMLS
jgi:hypothetical protein